MSPESRLRRRHVGELLSASARPLAAALHEGSYQSNRRIRMGGGGPPRVGGGARAARGGTALGTHYGVRLR